MSNTNILYLVCGVVSLFLCIAYNVNYDHKIWIKQRDSSHSYRPHKKGWRLKAVTSIPAVLFLALPSEFKWFWALSFSICLCMAVFLFLFDGWSAIKKGKGFFYTGTIDKGEDPETDKFFRSLPLWLHISIKSILVLSSGYIYILGLQK